MLTSKISTNEWSEHRSNTTGVIRYLISNTKVNLTSNMIVKKTVRLCVLLLVGVMLLGYSDLACQETDAFYKNLFKKLSNDDRSTFISSIRVLNDVLGIVTN